MLIPYDVSLFLALSVPDGSSSSRPKRLASRRQNLAESDEGFVDIEAECRAEIDGHNKRAAEKAQRKEQRKKQRSTFSVATMSKSEYANWRV